MHNISIVKGTALGIGDTIKVYKANMIIPQIAENLTRSGNLVIPDKCPVCGHEARIRKENDVETLYCMNPDCVAKKIKSFSLFTSRDAMNLTAFPRQPWRNLLPWALSTIWEIF